MNMVLAVFDVHTTGFLFNQDPVTFSNCAGLYTEGRHLHVLLRNSCVTCVSPLQVCALADLVLICFGLVGRTM